MLPRVLIVYAVDPGSEKATKWSDGFVKGMRSLADRFSLSWCNVYDHDDLTLLDSPKAFDFILAKSNWGWVVDRLVRSKLRWSETPRGIVISGSTLPPSARAMRFYDVLYGETHWYMHFLNHHPRTLHAFGIDDDVMTPDPPEEKIYDWIFIGSLVPYKRPEALLEKTGVRLAVTGPRAEESIREMMLEAGIEVKSYVDQKELALFLRRSRRALIPCTLQGGGERAVLEARSCGIPVEISNDNPKLAELLESPIYGYRYYGAQIAEGIAACITYRKVWARKAKTALSAPLSLAPSQVMKSVIRRRQLPTPSVRQRPRRAI